MLTETTRDILSAKLIMHGGEVTNDFWLRSPNEVTERPQKQKANGFIQSSGLFLQMSIRDKRDSLLRAALM